MRVSGLNEEVEVSGSHVPPGVEGPLHGSPRYYLALIFVNDLHGCNRALEAVLQWSNAVAVGGNGFLYISP